MSSFRSNPLTINLPKGNCNICRCMRERYSHIAFIHSCLKLWYIYIYMRALASRAVGTYTHKLRTIFVKTHSRLTPPAPTESNQRQTILIHSCISPQNFRLFRRFCLNSLSYVSHWNLSTWLNNFFPGNHPHQWCSDVSILQMYQIHNDSTQCMSFHVLPYAHDAHWQYTTTRQMRKFCAKKCDITLSTML